MSDLSNIFNLRRKQSQANRAHNRATRPAQLKAAGLSFTTHNNGVHLVIEGKVDYYPGTGLWLVRGTCILGRGVNRLLEWFRSKGLLDKSN